MARRAQADDDHAAPAVGDLFTVRPEEFVAARNAVVKALKAAGEREEAAKVATLRRPSAVDWALNCVALAHADTVDQFIDAATSARDAQAAVVEGRGGGDLRAAVATLRETSGGVARLVDDVLASSGKASSANSSAVASRLTAVAASAALGDQLRQHRLGSDADADKVDDLFAGLEPATAPATKPARATPPPKPKTAPSKAAPDPRELARALTAAERAESSALSAVTRAAERLRRAEAAVVEAEERLANARLACASASAEHDRLVQAADAASRNVASAQANVAAARSEGTG